ncbi:MAG TPA: bifunctional riboflavin kinase/FAD synthetase [Rhizomicrobium sp.]|jgi:riboflavin kinase/FMN adenylyltransferase|nr:bifunctional riboflavin kinase/FAD synthetase [Rhizomicrobium sp.]
MKIFRHYDEVPASLKGAVVAVGNFDGVHLGHQALIAEARAQAKARNAPLAVLAFEPHPAEFFRPRPDSIRLTPLRTKARLLAELGVDAMFALTFDDSMAKRSAGNFVSDVLVNGLGLSGVVVGPDFEFGQGRAGNVAILKEMGAANGFTVTVFDMVKTAGEKISSTRIRDSLKAAHPEDAARLLGRFWAIEARVEHGDGRGRTMGFPTANMHLGHCLAPAFGVYAVRVTITENEKPIGRHDGVANFGIRPMYQTPVPLMEAHLFDFDGDLYGKHLAVELIAYLRPEAKFADLDALIAQIAADAQKARKILAQTPQTPT